MGSLRFLDPALIWREHATVIDNRAVYTISSESKEDCLLTEREIARRLMVSSHAVRRWRAIGAGPPWIRIGKRLVRYSAAGLRRWIESQVEAGDGQ
jgi:predicted DNA-binding transcriptional regulator AlpA